MLAEARIVILVQYESYRICEPDIFCAILPLVMTCRDLLVLRYFRTPRRSFAELQAAESVRKKPLG